MKCLRFGGHILGSKQSLFFVFVFYLLFFFRYFGYFLFVAVTNSQYYLCVYIRLCVRVCVCSGRNDLIDVATALEKAALEDEYFISRNLYPNLDFYSGLVYATIGFPVDMFPGKMDF